MAWLSRHRYPLIGLAAMLGVFYIFTTSFTGWFVPNDRVDGMAGRPVRRPRLVRRHVPDHADNPQFPVWPVVLAPIRALSDVLGLKSGFSWVGVETSPPHATAWLLYGPVAVIASSVLVFAGDALATVMDATKLRRMLLCGALSAVCFFVAVYWGHPEDMATTGLLLFGMLALHQGRPARAGWLTGLALVVNPLVILAVPVLLAMSATAWRRYTLRVVVIPAIVLLPALLTTPTATWDALGDQKTFLQFHQTIFVSLGHHVGNVVVYAGPIRLVVVAIVAVMGFMVTRRTPDLTSAVAIAGAALLARQLAEPIMFPYYLAPGIAVLGIVLLTRQPAARVLAGVAAAVLAFCLSCISMSPWLYSLLVAVPSAALVWIAWPRRAVLTAPSAPTGASEPVERRPSVARLAAVGVIVLVAMIGITVYGRSSWGPGTRS